MPALAKGIDWRREGACHDPRWDADWWTATTGDEATRWALWLCWHECPVRALCRAWANGNPELTDRATYGGVCWTRGHPEQNPSRVPRPSPQTPRPVRPVPGATPEMRTGRTWRTAVA